MPTESAEKSDATPASFEASLARLTSIVEQLERGDLTLEDSLRLFEEGVKLSRTSQERLDGAQKRVDELLKVDEEGRATTTPFQTTEEER